MINNDEYNTYINLENKNLVIPTTTYFFRENMLETLCFLDSLKRLPKEYAIIPSSNGKEAYSLAIWLRSKTSNFKINAYDINEIVLKQAKKGLYSIDIIDKLFFSAFKDKCKMSKKFFEKVLKTKYEKIVDQKSKVLKIPEELKKYVNFYYGDITKNYFPGEVVLSFNLLYHFEDEEIYKKSLYNLLKSAKKLLVIDKHSFLEKYLANSKLKGCVNKKEDYFLFENKIFQIKKGDLNLYFEVMDSKF